MKYCQAKIGRVFVVRLEDGDKLPAILEEFASQHRVKRAICFLLGGIKDGGRLVVGPNQENARPVEPLYFELLGVHEFLALGMIFPGTDKKPHLHLHGTMGREGRSYTGCLRPGVEVWQVGEVMLVEIVGTKARRLRDDSTGFELLHP
ncbi:MAG: DNA-binding protein [Candidatus Omnitrophica bacterium]|nr:DNA-binding protein [Candidatus Omnitrophota bacterium]